MKGTGTKEDMYIPESWDDFVTALGTTGAYVSVPEGTTYDMDTIAPEGIPTIITRCSNIYGNGLTISKPRNLCFKRTGSTSETTSFHDIEVNDFTYSSALAMFYAYDGYMRAYDSTFNGMGLGHHSISRSWSLMSNSSYLGTNCNSNYTQLYRCSGNIEVTTQGTCTNIGLADTVYDCNFSIRLPDNFNWDAISNELLDTDMRNSYVEFLGPDRANAPTSSIGASSGIHSNSILVFPGQHATLLGVNGKKYIRCTKDQLADPAWVREQGFPIPYAELR